MVNPAFESEEEGLPKVLPSSNGGKDTATVAPLTKKPGPQKIQSTPNFFVNKLHEKKMLDRSISVPNFYKKRSKEENKIL